MTDLTPMLDYSEQHVRTDPPMLNQLAAEPAFSRKDLLMNAMSGDFAQDSSLELLFDWLEGRK